MYARVDSVPNAGRMYLYNNGEVIGYKSLSASSQGSEIYWSIGESDLQKDDNVFVIKGQTAADNAGSRATLSNIRLVLTFLADTPDLTLTKEITPAQILVGQQATVKVRIANSAPDSTTGNRTDLTDAALPAGVSLVSGSLNDSSFAERLEEDDAEEHTYVVTSSSVGRYTLGRAHFEYRTIVGDYLEVESDTTVLEVRGGGLTVVPSFTERTVGNAVVIDFAANINATVGGANMPDAHVQGRIYKQEGANWNLVGDSINLGYDGALSQYCGSSQLIAASGNYKAVITAQRDLYDDGTSSEYAFTVAEPPTYTLTVSSSNPDSGVAIASTTGHEGTTSYTKAVVVGETINLEAPESIGSGASRKRFVGWDSNCSVGEPVRNKTFQYDTLCGDENGDMWICAVYEDAPEFAPIITTSSPLPNGTVDRAYSVTLAASGGATPYTWSLDSGNLPDGLSLSSGGVISGTPTASGTSSFTMRVTGDNNLSSTKEFDLTIAGVAPTITTSEPLPNGVIGRAYSTTLAASGGTTPYRWSLESGTLPAGLNLNDDGVISGTPTASGTCSFTVRVTGGNSLFSTEVLSLTVSAEIQEGDYMIIDLSGGSSASSYPVSYLSSVPVGGWTDEYKTTKLVMRRVPKGTFTMGSATGYADNETLHDVTLTKDFYLGIFEVTQKQWELIRGTTPSFFTGDTLPVERVYYSDIRGNDVGKGWPANNKVDYDSFIGNLRTKTGLADLDLPTEAQWEYACRAGTTGEYAGSVNDLGWHAGNTAPARTQVVGAKQANPWGLYDMHGNVWEICLDWYSYSLGSMEQIDPPGPGGVNPGALPLRVMRGGAYNQPAEHLRSAVRWNIIATNQLAGGGNLTNFSLPYGFRVAMSAKTMHYTLTVSSSNPDAGVIISSLTGHGGTTRYTKTVSAGETINLGAPEFVGSGASRKRFVGWDSNCSVGDPVRNKTFQYDTECGDENGDMWICAVYEDDPDGDFPCDPLGDAVLTTTGSYDGYLYADRTFKDEDWETILGTLNVRISNLNGRLTAKAVLQAGSVSFSGRQWTEQNEDGTYYSTLTARSGETLDLFVRQNRIWGVLSGGKLGDDEVFFGGARNRFADRKDAAAQAALNQYKGYYTARLESWEFIQGALNAAPNGYGYLTLTVNTGGRVRIAGVLADGTRVSQSSRLLYFADCDGGHCYVPFFVPLYRKTGYVSGLFWINSDTLEIYNDLPMRWENPGKGPDGFTGLLDMWGAAYAPTLALSEEYLFSAYLDEEVCAYHNAGEAWGCEFWPEGVPVNVTGSRLTIARGDRPVRIREDGETWYEYGGVNPNMVTLSFAARTGIFRGNFTLYYDYYDERERFQHKTVRVPYVGVLIQDPETGRLDLGYGHCLFPSKDPELRAYRIKPSFPVELGGPGIDP
jgi:formylglycine-generating enzyme required for sulfatase activity